MSPKTFFYIAISLWFSVIFFPYKLNNSCNNYWSYFNLYFSDNCYHNPDFEKDVPEIITSHIGSCEVHQISTEDGYILGLFRIPHHNPKGVILFQHSMLSDARIWVAQHHNSIAFLFWKAGYDVWLGNTRGTRYSRKHNTLDSRDSKFWNYSLDKLAYYDNNATIEYIKTKTRSKIVYVGLSVAATTALMYSGRRSEDAVRSLKLVVAIAPGTIFQHTSGLLLHVSPLIPIIQRTSKHTGFYSIGRYDAWYLLLFRNLHMLFPFKRYIVSFLSFWFGGTGDELDPNFANLIVAQCCSEMSFQPVHHFYQMFAENKSLRMYDYGEEENVRKYKNRKPPVYKMENLKVPTFLVYGQNDSISAPEEMEELYEKFPKETKIYGKLEVEGFNHIDFIYGKRRNEKVYSKILELLNNL